MRETLAALGASVLLLVACLPEDLGPMPTLEPPQWQDGEVSVYDVSKNDRVMYRAVLTLRYDEELGAPGGDGVAQAIPTLVATNVVRPLSDVEFFLDSVQVVFRRDDITPLRTYRTVETDISEFEIVARYSSSRVRIDKQTIDGGMQQELRLPARFHSYDMVQTWLRCVPPTPGTSFRNHLVVPFEFRTVPVKFMVLGTKLVTTGVGDILCREMVLILPSREVRFWYELAQPHRFVGLKDAQNDAQMLLRSYQPSGPDTTSIPAGSEPSR